MIVLCVLSNRRVREYVIHKSSHALLSLMSFTQDICELVNSFPPEETLWSLAPASS